MSRSWKKEKVDGYDYIGRSQLKKVSKRVERAKCKQKLRNSYRLSNELYKIDIAK